MHINHDDVNFDNLVEEKEGASGLVKFGVHDDSGTAVAVKYLKKKSADANARFVQENEILFDLFEHDNVILPYSRILTSNELGLPCYIMERADETLIEWLDRYPSDEDLPQRAKMITSICNAIISIQKAGYIHRDLHEDNILIFSADNEAIPKLMDFGRSYKKHGTFDGSDRNSPTWGYYLMPPEIEFGLITHDDPSHILGDAYAVGLLIKTILSYDAPTNFGNLRDMKRKITNFKKLKNNGSASDYLTNRTEEERKQDYLEWCRLNGTWSQRWLSVELADQAQTDVITELVKSFSNINYLERKSDLQIVIDALKGI